MKRTKKWPLRSRGAVTRFFGLLLAGLVFSAQTPPSAETELDFFLTTIQKAFDARDREGYLASFLPERRSFEAASLDVYYGAFAMNRVAFHRASRLLDDESGPAVFLQVLFQNENAALLETWKLGLVREDAGWRIRSRDAVGNPASLYNLRIPSDRVERAARIEIRHADIDLVFENAWLFYDNIPGLETGLIIVGPGRMRFAPSVEAERHQLGLRYKSGALDEKLISAYLRFSDSWFRERVTIVPAAGPVPPPTEEILIRARSLFRQHYPGSFTIENSINGERLSFVPQGDQAVFEVMSETRGGFGYIYSPFSEEEIHFLSRSPDQIVNLYSPETEGDGERRMFVSFGQKYDVLRCDVDLDLQPRRFFLSAKARVEVRAMVSGLDSLQFELHPALDLLKVSDPSGRELFFTQDKVRRLLYVYLLDPLERGKTAAIEIFYRGTLEPPVQTMDVVAAGQIGEPIRLLMPNYDSYLYSQSAAWYPAPTVEDYFLSRVRISLPPEYTCVANGALLEEIKVDEVRRVLTLEKIGNRIWVFETGVPVKYLSFIAGLFDKSYFENGEARPPIHILVSEDIRDRRKSVIEETRSVVRAYEGWFGAYPFEKLTIVQRVWPTAGGHSPASFIVLNELPRNPDAPIAPDPDSPVDLPRYREYFLAHEIAHQWWGQSVTGAGYRDQWLSEGLSQYAAVRYIREKHGDRVLPAILRKFAQWTTRKAAFGPVTLGTRLSLLDFRAYQAIVYNKTALVLFMLSDLIGEETFDRGLRNFFEAHRHKPARTAQFVMAMETASGRDLQAFFRDWFGSHHLPVVRATTEVVKDGNEYVLKVRVQQSGRPFVFPLVVSWEENRRPVRRILDVDAPVKEFAVRTGVRPAKIKVNPDRILPGRITS